MTISQNTGGQLTCVASSLLSHPVDLVESISSMGGLCTGGKQSSQGFQIFKVKANSDFYLYSQEPNQWKIVSLKSSAQELDLS